MKKPKAVRSLLYSGDLLAVDLGTFSVKILSMKARERSLTVTSSATKEVWRELADAKTDAEKGEVYARALRELIGDRTVRPRNASIALSGSVVLLRFAALPAGYAPDPDAGLPAEARALIPFDEPDAPVSALFLDEAKAPGARPEVMLTVARRATVAWGMDIVRAAGLRPAVIINDSLALANAYEFFEGGKTNETVVLVNVGATSSGICIVEDGVMRAARVVNIAGSAFTRAVKREFDNGLEEAEALKLAHGFAAAPDDEIAGRVAGALKVPVKDLSAEIVRTIDVFLERRPADYRPIRRVVLAGGSAALKGLSARVAADTGLEASLFRPIVNVPGADGTLGIVPLATSLAGPCGLALSNTLLRRSDRRINLVPRRARRSAILRDVTPGFWRLITGPAVVVVALSVYAVWAVNVTKHEAAVEKELEAAAAKERAAEHRFTKKKAVIVVKRVENPYAYLSGLSISGVFGDGRSSLVMLNGGAGVFVARGGRLYDANEEIVRGVTSEIRNNALALDAGGRTYTIQLPK